MRILLVDTTLYYPASPIFQESLDQLSRNGLCEYRFVDEQPYAAPLQTSIFHKAAYRVLRRRPLTFWSFNRTLLLEATRYRPDLVLIVKGAMVASSTLEAIKRQTKALLVNYATDDPFNRLVNTPSLIRSIPLYDLYCSTRLACIDDLQNAGAKNVLYLPFAYKPEVHFPEKAAVAEEQQRFSSDTVFVGGCDRDRIPYFDALVKGLNGLQLHLYGGYWKDKPQFKQFHRGYVLGRDYRLALSGTKVAINLVRRANRDGHVMRSFEIPACAAFMLAERTDEHKNMFFEEAEVALFDSPEELVEKVRFYCSRESERKTVAEAGFKRIRSGKNTYADRLLEILHAIKAL